MQSDLDHARQEIAESKKALEITECPDERRKLRQKILNARADEAVLLTLIHQH